MSLPNEIIPLSLSGTGAAEEQYQIERSLRFNSFDGAYLSRTPGTGNAGNRQIWTWAGWVKRSYGAYLPLLFARHPSFSGWEYFFLATIDSTDKILIETGSNVLVYTNNLYRDYSSWMHIVFAIDATQIVAENRLKLYVNGEEITSFSSDGRGYITKDTDGYINSTDTHTIGSSYSNTRFADGYLADIHFIDGQALTPSSFGETDANGIWQPKAYTGSYGTNGFHLDFKDNSTTTSGSNIGIGKDVSGNSNYWNSFNLSTDDAYSYSVSFPGSSSISVLDNEALRMGSGDFTIEFWLRYNALSGYQTIVDKGYGTAGGFVLQTPLNSGNINVYLNQSTLFTTTGTVNVDTWYHHALVRSGTTVTMYRNGVSVGSGTTNANFNSTGDFYAGGSPGGGGYYSDSYISNLRIVKGTAVYTSPFTPPTTNLSVIPNTVLLTCQSPTFVDNSTNAFTVTNNGSAAISGSVNPFAGQPDGFDMLVDSPTNYGTDTGAGGEVRGNYATWNSNNYSSSFFSDGNLKFVPTTGYNETAKATMAIGDKCYFEVTILSPNTAQNYLSIGLMRQETQVLLGSTTGYNIPVGESGNYTGSVAYRPYGGTVYYNGSSVVTGLPTCTVGDVVGISYDPSNGQVKVYKNGVALNSGNAVYTLSTAYRYAPAMTEAATNAYYVNFGQRPFAYPAAGGFKALCTQNLPDPNPNITPPSKVMDVKLYTGNGSTQTISGLGFSPDLVWIKSRSHARDNNIYDTVRGATKLLSTNTTSYDVYSGTVSEQTVSGLTDFNSDGFSLGSDNVANQNTYTYAAWAWDAGTSTVTNTDGTITSQVRANTSAGFSIVTYSQGSTGGTVGHGLGVAPGLIVVKSINNTWNWPAYHKSLGGSLALQLDTTSTQIPATNYWGTPNSSTFGVGTAGGAHNNIGNLVAYCWAPVDGYSAFGSYTGNGSTNGPFVYTGFRPRWVMWKSASTGGAVNYDWIIQDTARRTYNVVDATRLSANTSNSESSDVYVPMDILSNGFKMRGSGAEGNGNAEIYVYAAFAENPFKVARAR